MSMTKMHVPNSIGRSGTPHHWYRTLLFVVIAGAIVWYITFQAQHLIAGPQIALSAPTAVTQQSRVITVTGSTENITALTLNGREIFTNKDGIFKEPLVLQNGYTIMTLEATGRYGRTTRVSHPYIYVPRPETEQFTTTSSTVRTESP